MFRTYIWAFSQRQGDIFRKCHKNRKFYSKPQLSAVWFINGFFFIKIIVNVITCADAILKIICSLTIRINVTKNYIGLCKNESTTKLSIDVTCILCKQNERIESSQFLFKQNSRIMLEKANMTCWGNLRFFSFLLTKV